MSFFLKSLLRAFLQPTQIMFYPDERDVLGDGTKTMRFSNKCKTAWFQSILNSNLFECFDVTILPDTRQMTPRWLPLYSRSEYPG